MSGLGPTTNPRSELVHPGFAGSANTSRPAVAGLALRPTTSPSAQSGSNVTFCHCDELSRVAGFVVSSFLRFVVFDRRHGTPYPRARGRCRGSAYRKLAGAIPVRRWHPGADSRRTEVRPVGPPQLVEVALQEELFVTVTNKLD